MPVTTRDEGIDWRTDWLYSLIMARAEKAWQMCLRTADTKRRQYVLIAEWSDADDSMCCGKPVGAWIRMADGLNEITIPEYKKHKRKIRERIYPFILMEFHISADRKNVVLRGGGGLNGRLRLPVYR